MSKFFKEIYQRIHGATEILLKGGYTQIALGTLASGDLLNKKNVLITGGSCGIGYAIAEAYLKQGAYVVIVGRNKKGLLEAKQKLNSQFLNIVEGDVSTRKGVEEIYQKAINIFGKTPDILINNAGVIAENIFEQTNSEEWHRVMDINLAGVYFMCQQFVKTENGASEAYRKILNIGSVCGIVGADSPYGCSKWAVAGLTKGLAKKYINHRIIVNCIAPGNVATRLNSIDPNKNAYTTENLFNRIIFPQEVAELAIYLGSDLSNSVVGQVIAIDGGTTLQ